MPNTPLRSDGLDGAAALQGGGEAEAPSGAAGAVGVEGRVPDTLLGTGHSRGVDQCQFRGAAGQPGRAPPAAEGGGDQGPAHLACMDCAREIQGEQKTRARVYSYAAAYEAGVPQQAKVRLAVLHAERGVAIALQICIVADDAPVAVFGPRPGPRHRVAPPRRDEAPAGRGLLGEDVRGGVQAGEILPPHPCARHRAGQAQSLFVAPAE